MVHTAVRGQEARRCGDEKLHSASLSVCCCCCCIRLYFQPHFILCPICAIHYFLATKSPGWDQGGSGTTPRGARNHVGIQIHSGFESNEKTAITLFARSSTRCLLSCPLSSQVNSNPCALQRPAEASSSVGNTEGCSDSVVNNRRGKLERAALTNLRADNECFFFFNCMFVFSIF